MILLRLVSWPYFRKHVLRSLLTAMGVVLGVAVFVGMHLGNQSVLVAFSRTIDRIAGKTDIQITAGEVGFPEEILEKVQSHPSVRVAVPVIEAVVEGPNGGNLLVLAVDMTGDRELRDYNLEKREDALVEDELVFLAQADSLMIAREFADRNHLVLGSRLSLGTAEGERAFTVRGLMKTTGLASAFGGNLAVMDVYAAQKMFGRGRTFDRIDVAVKRGVTLADATRGLTELLGPGFDIQPPASRGRQAESMLAGYSMMINMSSAFALFIGMFIVYNSFAIAVSQRRSEIGILRALGATREQIRWLFLGESAAISLFGSVLGIGAGLLMARVVATAVSGLVGDVYGMAHQAGEVTAGPIFLGLALAVGVGTSLVAAVIPAHEAAKTDPVHALKKGGYQIASATAYRKRGAAAVAVAIAAAACLVLGPSRWLLYAGYAFTLLAALLFAPICSLGLAKGLRPVLKWLQPVEGALAADSLIQTPHRTAATVAALMLSLALVVAFSGMARASYDSILGWVDTSLNADLFVMPSQRLDIRTTRFPASMASGIAEVPGVARVQMFRSSRITFRGASAMLVAIEMPSIAQTNRRAPIAGDAAEMYRKAASGEGLLVSDSLAQLRGLSLGETVEIPAPYGSVRLPIVGIVLDYTDQQGSILVDRSVFLKHWQDDSVSDFRVFVAPGAAADVRQRIINRFAGERHVFVLTHEEGRRYILRITDQWFGLMNVQIAIAVLIAMLGIVNTLTVSIADRRREFGVLRAVGALHAQIRRTIWIEAVAVGVLGLVAGYVLGAANLYYMLQIVQREVAGLRLEYDFPVRTLLVLVPLILGAAFVAALAPAESAVRSSLVEALEYE